MIVDVSPEDEAAIVRAIGLAEDLLGEIAPPDPRLVAVVRDPAAAAFTMTLTDEVLRCPDAGTASATLRALVARGLPAAFPATDRLLLRLGALASRAAPKLVMSMVSARLRSVSSGQVLSASDPVLARRLARTHATGSATNVNVLGEAIIGEGEAIRRRDRIVEVLARADVDAVSVKLSAIAANLSALAFDDTVERLAGRLRPLYRAAAQRLEPAMVTLDMEEFRDLDLTAATFMRVLGEPEFLTLPTGIVLQAYLPDSHGVATRLAEFALDRHRGGGAPIRIRVVKGANLAMERVEAELRGWNVAPYDTKADVDASFKRLLDRLLVPELDGAVVVGLASHNVFDIAWGLLLRDGLAARGHGDRLEFETLEGMAGGLAAGIARRGATSLVYLPVVDRRSFESAIAYLVRRLDENTSPENFLNALVDLHPESPRFELEGEKFAAAVRSRGSVTPVSRRNAGPAVPGDEEFHNAPDTDLSVVSQRQPLLDAVREWQPRVAPIRAVIAGVEQATLHRQDIQNPSTGAAIGTAELADETLVDECIDTARHALTTWSGTTHERRRQILRRVAAEIADRRAEIIATMAHETGKTIAQGDPEVSEAIDFARYYAASIATIEQLEDEGVVSRPHGVVVVAPPWNFPFAILMGGVTGALAAGNVVVIKPAPQAMLSAHMVATCCWNAGVPTDVVQFLPCPDDEVGRHLIAHPGVDTVILTGSIETARMFLGWRPGLRVLAETSGKNAMVITASADIDQALKDLVTSAFGHAGQKCSAASLAILAPCWYDDPDAMARLADAVRSLHCGDAASPVTDVGPLIDPPSPHLLRALTELDSGESWLVEPVCLDEGGRRWSPGIRLGVVPGSWFHRTECFGPVLGVMRAVDLDAALAAQNAVEFGLTAGIHSLNQEEVDDWCARVEAGNLYVNRSITGAVVQRQPFGGWKRSAVGPGAKAGGPGYVLALRHWEAAASPATFDTTTVEAAFESVWEAFFAPEHDPSGLIAERNVLRHCPLPNGVLLRLGAGAAVDASWLALAASKVTGTPVTISDASDASDESDDELAERLPTLRFDRLRLVGRVDDVLRIAAHRLDLTVDDAPVLPNARLELAHWCREQSVTTTLHRHGHVLPRTMPTLPCASRATASRL